MAEASFSQDQFSCPVCLDVLKDPVTIPCGHSYCMSCITDCWDQEDQKLIYSCPQCRQTFTPRPALCKNVMIAEMVEKLKKTNFQKACPQSYAGPGDVGCDVCTGRKYKAVKSCFECLNSYCQSHLEQHESFFKDRRHNLMDPTRRLQEMICPKHNKQLEIYCRTDQQCICYPCLMDEHKIHDTVTAETERTEKQRLLGETQRKFEQGIQERQKQLRELRDAVKSHKHSVQGAVDESERIFTELIRSIERSRSEVTRLIRVQEKAAVSRAEGILQQIEQEIDDLKRRDAELEQLSHTDDHVYFLQRFQYIAAPPESADLHSITASSLLSFQDVAKSISHLKDKLEGFCTEEVEKIFNGVTCIETPTNEPKTREQFLQCKAF
ncbi:E3 ubiquitin-protein ligase TRIM47 isoform X1 [Siphateles boraxobius]|uniref:E3 ubiquitin-protein ligase TRIM47 isoform X1 n=1 Tax=Siphateles boraxobius TaxID=180520 RepID=UPI00406455DA